MVVHLGEGSVVTIIEGTNNDGHLRVDGEPVVVPRCLFDTPDRRHFLVEFMAQLQGLKIASRDRNTFVLGRS